MTRLTPQALPRRLRQLVLSARFPWLAPRSRFGPGSRFTPGLRLTLLLRYGQTIPAAGQTHDQKFYREGGQGRSGPGLLHGPAFGSGGVIDHLRMLATGRWVPVRASRFPAGRGADPRDRRSKPSAPSFGSGDLFRRLALSRCLCAPRGPAVPRREPSKSLGSFPFARLRRAVLKAPTGRTGRRSLSSAPWCRPEGRRSRPRRPFSPWGVRPSGRRSRCG